MQEKRIANERPISKRQLLDAVETGKTLKAWMWMKRPDGSPYPTVVGGKAVGYVQAEGSGQIVSVEFLRDGSEEIERIPFEHVTDVGLFELRKKDDEHTIRYRNLGHLGGDQYVVAAMRGGRRVGLYYGYLRERDEGMDLYIREGYERGLPGKVKIAIRMME